MELLAGDSYALVIEDQAKGYVRFQGMDYELGSKHIEIAGQTQHTITVKVPGHSYWAGHYIQRGYEPTYFQTYSVRRILQEPPNGVLILEVCKIGAEIPARMKALPYRPMAGYNIAHERGTP